MGHTNSEGNRPTAITVEKALPLLRARAESVQLYGHGLHVKDVSAGHPGYFRPPGIHEGEDDVSDGHLAHGFVEGIPGAIRVALR